MYKTVSILNATKSFTEQWIICYVNFVSIKKKNMERYLNL